MADIVITNAEEKISTLKDMAEVNDEAYFLLKRLKSDSKCYIIFVSLKYLTYERVEKFNKYVKESRLTKADKRRLYISFSRK